MRQDCVFTPGDAVSQQVIGDVVGRELDGERAIQVDHVAGVGAGGNQGAQALHARAREQGLASSREWHVLLHYRGDRFGRGDEREIRNDHFIAGVPAFHVAAKNQL